MKITDITIEQLDAVEQTYREVNPNPIEAAQASYVLEKNLKDSRLEIPMSIFRSINASDAAFVLGVEIGILLAETGRNN